MPKRRGFFVPVMTLALLVALISCVTPSQETSVTATISVSKQTLAGHVADDFVGFSIEPRYLCQFLALEHQGGTLDQLYRSFGPTIIRIGGNAMDHSQWQPRQPCHDLTFGRSTIDGVFTFAQRVDARIIWGINLKANAPASASDEAAYVAAVGGSRLLGLELGNEPNGWSSGADFMKTWQTYAAAIAAVAPQVALLGPAMYDDAGQNWFHQFIQQEHARLVRVTYHYYPLHLPSDATSANSPTLAHLLGSALMKQTAADLARVVREAGAYQLPLEVGETNSANQGGVPGVSDVFASALWGADYLFTAAEAGVAAVNLHGNGGTPSTPPYVDTYAPITVRAGSDAPSARPLYYGMLLFHLAAGGGGSPVKATVTSAANVSAHVIDDADGTLHIVIINKDMKNAVTATVNVGSLARSYQNGGAIRLLAPSLAATRGITLGGDSVGTDGTWVAGTTEPVGIHDHSLTIAVPAGSAVLVTLTP